MADLTKPLGPVQSSERINSLDILRGIALLGILLMNIAGFGLVFQAYGNPAIQGGATGWNLNVWIMNSMFFEGTMRALFSMLFGVGMVLMTSRMEKRGGGLEVADIYYRRTIWLLLFGVVHAYLILWPGDILFAYGLFGLFLFPFRKASAKSLIVAAAILTLIGVGLEYLRTRDHLENYSYYQEAATYDEAKIPTEVTKGKKAWAAGLKKRNPSPENIEDQMDKMHSGYGALVLHLAPINRMAQSISNYDYNPWDVLPMMLLGIALFKLNIITAKRRVKTYLLLVLAGYGIGLPINYYETSTLLNNNFAAEAFLNTGLTYPFGRIAMAIGHIGVIMLFCKLNILAFLKKSLAAVGRMALTNYIMHSVICAIIFTGIGFSLFGRLQRYELYYIVAGIWLFQLILSPLWLRYFRFGPLEWLWRSLTYQKLQPFRRIKVITPLQPRPA